MKGVEIIVWFCVALLPSFICGTPNESITDKQLESPTHLKEALNRMAENDEIINDIFKPAKDGYLGSGIYGVTFAGTLYYPNSEKIEVAMKFTHFKKKKYAEKEYAIYSYLDAIDNPKVELNGILSVYYYGTWRCTVMMGISLLDSEFNKKHETGNLNVLDALIICKEFVRISKYIHSFGICHRDIKLANIMFRRNNGFIIDYNRAEKMYNTSTLDTSSRLAGIKLAKIDWKMFIRTICICLKIQIKNILQDEQYMHIMEQFKSIKYKELGRVFFEMGKHIVGLEIGSYDRVYNFIKKEIEEYKGETPKLVHWLKNEERSVAKHEIETIPLMSSIAEPFMLAKISYLDPDPDHFHKKILRLKSGESSSENNKKKSSKIQTSKIGSSENKRRT